MTTRILVVDDHPVTRNALRNAIEQAIESPQIALAGSLAEAFSLTPTPYAHDLVLLALTLPDATGVATCGAWCPRLPGSSVIAITDVDDPDTREGCIAAGAMACAPKTSETRLIIETISRALEAVRRAAPGSQAGAWRTSAATAPQATTPCAVPPDPNGGVPASTADTTRHGASGWAGDARQVPRAGLAGWRTLPGVRYGGAMPPEPSRTTTGVDGGHHLNLTPRQRQVLRLLLQGQPNKRICRELDLAEGTVKVHVSAVLRALNVTNRAQVVVAAARLGIRVD
ncbi:MAG: LuxR C-terminal-related transcriptional regulator [Lautropia sp.]